MKRYWKTEALSTLEYGGGVTIVREAERKKDEKLFNRIRGFEAKYQKSCRTQYFQKSDKSAMLQNKLEEGHIKAFKTRL